MSKTISNLSGAFLTKIQALYDVETQLVKAVPKVAKASTNPELKKVLADHLEETKGHVSRLEQIFGMLDEKPKKLKVEAIRGLIADTQWCIDQEPASDVLDAMIVASTSYVEHYEMAGYIAAQRWAVKLGLGDAAELLHATLDEEKGGADKLEQLGQESVDDAALAGAGEDEEK
jgi:ferritin-like metal-binding protein YciE